MNMMREGLVQRIARDHGESIAPQTIRCAVVDNTDLLWNFEGQTR